VILMQMVGAAFFTANMFMLEAWSGFILNALGILRALVYANKEKFRNMKLWNAVFFICYGLSYVSVFALFGRPVTFWNLILEMLPTSAMVVSTVAFSRKDAAAIRKFRGMFPDAEAFHMSGKMLVESGMAFRKEGVPMGLPGFDEWHIQQTSTQAVREARLALDEEN
jgi:hypothetical protein